jgi:PII-like signaling protein
MRERTPAKILRLHFSERDRYQGKPLHEAIVRKCRDMNVAGATVFRGLEGYGETGEMHERHVAASDQPIVVVIVDNEEKLKTCVPVFEQMMTTGVMAISDVEMIRVRREATETAHVPSNTHRE